MSLNDFPLLTHYAAAAKSLQSCPTLCDPIDGSPLGSSVPGILQARTLEWVAIAFSNAWKWKVKVKSLSRVWLLATPWTTAYQAPPSMGFSRQEDWSGVPFGRIKTKFLAQYPRAFSSKVLFPHDQTCSHAFRETNSLRRTVQIVECSLLRRQAHFLWKPYVP